MAHLNGRTALVTGGTRGIGLAISRRLAEDGARVALVGRGADSVKTATEELHATGHDVLGIVADVQPHDFEGDGPRFAVIDHHPLDHRYHAEFLDVRPGLGATATK